MLGSSEPTYGNSQDMHAKKTIYILCLNRKKTKSKTFKTNKQDTVNFFVEYFTILS